VSDKKVRLALIGCGGITRAHLRGYQQIKQKEPDKFDIVACCDTVKENAERFAADIEPIQGTKPKVYTDVEEVLKNEQLDGADITTPHHIHHVAAIACLEAGVNVLIEKPVGVTIKATKAIIAAAQKSGKFAATAEQIRRGPMQRTAHWLFNTNKLIGEPRLFYSQSASWSRPNQPTPWHWRVEKALGGGGMVMDSGAHYCDTIRYLFGDVDSVYARVEQLEKRQLKKGDEVIDETREDTWVATLNFKSGLIGLWSWSMSLPGHNFTHVVYYGTQGALVDSGDVFHGPFAGAYLHLPNGRTRRLTELHGEFLETLSDEQKRRLFPHGFTEQFTLECYDFLDAIQNNRPPEVSAEDGMKAKAIAEAIYESACINQVVKVQDVIDGKVENYQRDVNERWGL
jgi:predicted dehydrogenase